MNGFKAIFLLLMVLFLSIGAGCSSEKTEEAAKTEQSATATGQTGPVMRCEERFAELDVDKDGKVTFEEFSAISHPGGQADVIYKARDKDADSVLTMEEFCQGRGPGGGAGAGKQ